jgi:hypothetical protein
VLPSMLRVSALAPISLLGKLFIECLRLLEKFRRYCCRGGA